jgi:hypothetical protein
MKVEAISSSEIALNNLRVCLNYGENREYNCGQCEKCVRTMAILRAEKALERCTVFPYPLDLDEISKLSVKDPYTRAWQEILQRLEVTGNDMEFKRAIMTCLANAYEDKGEDKIKALEKQVEDYERLFIKQRAWTRDLEEGKAWLTQQLEGYRALNS